MSKSLAADLPRIMLAGNALAACLVLDGLLESVPKSNLAVIAPPGGAAFHSWQRSLAPEASKAGVECWSPSNVNSDESIGRIAQWQPDLLFSVQYTQIFSAALLAALPCRAINLHPSLLPRHRGTAPLIWAIVDGDRATGVTLHWIDTGVDTGRIVQQRSIPIHANETGFELHVKIANLASAVCGRFVHDWLTSGALPEGIEQQGASSVHRHKDANLNEIDLRQPSERIRNIVRALCPPLPGATVELEGATIVLGRVQPLDGVNGDPGTYEIQADQVILHASDRPLAIRSWFDGSQLEAGSTLPAYLARPRVS